MKRSLALALAVLLALGACKPSTDSEPAPSWQEFMPEGGGFSVLLPGTPSRESESDTSSFGAIDTVRFVDLVHVVDGLEHVQGMVSTCLADVPPPVRGLVGMRLIAENCIKHIRPCIYDARETKGMIEMALDRSNGNISMAARELQIARSTLYRKMKEFGMS